MEDSNLFPDLIIEALLNVEAVVVRENRKAGQYVDTVAQWAEDAGLKVYYGRVNFHHYQRIILLKSPQCRLQTSAIHN